MRRPLAKPENSDYMAIITLTSDWGTGNHYAGTVKGALLQQIPGATVVDISHDIASFDIVQASFVLKNAWSNFPANTIHLIGINSEGGIESPHIAVKYRDHYFIGADNGIFSLLFDDAPEAAIEIDVIQDSDFFTFSTRDVFVKVAALIASGAPLDTVGAQYPALKEKYMFHPVVHPGRIVAKVIFVDTYGNVFVNLDKRLFTEAGKGRPFMITFRAPDDGITHLHHSYSDVVPGEKVALFGSTGYLEIAINQGKASSLLGLQVNDTVTIEFS